jgi:hypothetical protein
MTVPNDYIGVSLRLQSSVRSPEEISTLLERTPGVTKMMGTPRGAGLWKTHYWCEDFGEGDVEERIRTIASVLVAKKAELASILAEDGKAYIYVFLALDTTLGIELEPSLLKALGDMNVELGIEISSAQGPVEPSPGTG